MSAAPKRRAGDADGRFMADREGLRSQFGRGLFPSLVVLHLGALAVAAISLAYAALLPPWDGGPTSARLDAIVEQAQFVGLWGIVTTVCLIAVAIDTRWLSGAAIVWLSALLAATPWRWPDAPLSRSDASDVPVWLFGDARPFLWASALLVVGFGVRLAWHRGQRTREVAMVVGGCVVALLVASNVRVALADRAEDPTPTADGAASLVDAEADALWSELPELPGQFDRPTAARLMAWGEEEPSKVVRTLPTDQFATVFAGSVQAAERTGWELARTYSPPAADSYRWVTFQKLLPTGPGELKITSSPAGYVSVTLTVEASAANAG